VTIWKRHFFHAGVRTLVGPVNRQYLPAQMHARKSTVKAGHPIWGAPRQGPGLGENSVAGTARKIVSLFLAAMLQWATVLTVCPSLHELIHHDADDEHHDCAVTMLLAGQLEQPAIDPIVITKPALVPVLLDQTCEHRSFGSFFLSCRLLEHAPPRRN
jgi:hypothetical protein